MANRPCKPDDDFKKLWQRLLPGVAVPACGVREDDEADKAGNSEPAADKARSAADIPRRQGI